MKTLLAAALLMAAFCQPAQAAGDPAGDPANALANASADEARAVAEIGQIVTAFQAALLAKDRAALEALFLPTDNSWLTVASDAKPRRAGPRVRASDYRRFAEFVATSKARIEERFYNVRIFSNGSIGTVYFDFDFLEDGQVTNRGAESWHLVRTETGWKTSSMVFSLG